ncbi:MAG: NADH-quinone oxidoreductase subunit M [Caldithrix sp.]|nr:NADH-quinone oxidoreductase subunit M [Caldithrix sp.]
MILIWLIAILMIGGILAWISQSWHKNAPRWIALIAAGVDFVLVAVIWLQNLSKVDLTGQSQWLFEVNYQWIPQWGISFFLAMDGLSLLMALLTTFLGLLSVVVSWTEIKERVGFFHFNLLWILAGIMGVFTALDLFLFYFFWEVMLVPMYFLIGIWGHENRIYAAYKFFIFTQASGLLMLLSILGLYVIHGQNTGNYTFNYFHLLGTDISLFTAAWLMLGFLIAFIVKLPAVPFHNWLPDAHTEAPTAGSVILAGLLLKTGAYGLLRFVIPLFPDISELFTPAAMMLGVLGILYGAKLAYAQIDLKRLVAYTSVSHMGFVILAVFSLNELALQGAVMQMICHGISTGALFILVGAMHERIHTRNIEDMGGMWETVPRMGGVGMLFAMASLGLPGLGNFVAEFLILVGAYQVSIFWTVLATVGLIAATVYSLRIVQRVFHGEKIKDWKIPDFNVREMVVMGSMIAVIVWLGLFPQSVLNTAKHTLNSLQQRKVIEQTAWQTDSQTLNQNTSENKTIIK